MIFLYVIKWQNVFSIPILLKSRIRIHCPDRVCFPRHTSMSLTKFLDRFDRPSISSRWRVCLSVSLPLCLSASLSVCLSVCLSIHLIYLCGHELRTWRGSYLNQGKITCNKAILSKRFFDCHVLGRTHRLTSIVISFFIATLLFSFFIHR